MNYKVSGIGHFQRSAFTAGLVKNVYELSIQVDDYIKHNHECGRPTHIINLLICYIQLCYS